MPHSIHFGPFEWDSDKERDTIEKHGLNFSEACLVFLDESRITKFDTKHSQEEERWFCIGRIGSRIATVRYTVRGPFIRILGAGYWRKGKEAYEKENQKKDTPRL